MQSVATKIKQLAIEYSFSLGEQIRARSLEMQNDDLSHFLIYQVLGISNNEGLLIDEY